MKLRGCFSMSAPLHFNKRQLIQLHSAGVRALRSWMTQFGALEICVPSLETRSSSEIRPTIFAEFDSHQFSLSQGNIDCLIDAAAWAKRCYYLSKVFRPSNGGLNRLLEFSYVSCVFPGDEHKAKQLFTEIIGFIRRACEAELDVDLNEPRLAEYDFKSACDLCGIEAGKDLSFSDQLGIVDRLGRNGVILTNKPGLGEPYRYEFSYNDDHSSLFEVLLPSCGEVGTGGRIETDYTQLKKSFEKSAFGKSKDAERQAELFNKSANTLVTTTAFFGFSFERLMQSFCGTGDILNSTPYGSAIREGVAQGLFSSLKSMP